MKPIDRACERFHEGLSRNGDFASGHATAHLCTIDRVLNRAQTGSREVRTCLEWLIRHSLKPTSASRHDGSATSRSADGHQFSKSSPLTQCARPRTFKEGVNMLSFLCRAIGLLIATAVIASIAVTPSYADEYVQLGTCSSSPGTGLGARTTLSAPGAGPNYPAGTPTRYYWVGTTLGDGLFMQVGYDDPALDTSCPTLRWFVYSQFITSSYPSTWDTGGCGLSGSQTLTLVNVGWNQTVNKYMWRAKVGGTFVGSYMYSAHGTLPASATGVVSEVSTTTSFNHSAPPGLPSARYDAAVQVLLASGSWIGLSTGKVLRQNWGNFWTPCPPYVIDDLGTNAVKMYSDSTPTSCLADGTVLW